ncbi:hypothetical protein, partial [Methylocella sp.]|jgi:hypothetical protein|uniref:hypothetical protein n=1 Tax=Methylocella sp. TaxID=1978226 RepID=UPI003C18159B
MIMPLRFAAFARRTSIQSRKPLLFGSLEALRALSSLIGVVEVKLFLFDHPGHWSFRSRGSLASLRGRRMAAA